MIEFSSIQDDNYYHIAVSDNDTSVGLATVKKTVNGFGGDIWVDSELGKGTKATFTIRKKPRVNR